MSVVTPVTSVGKLRKLIDKLPDDQEIGIGFGIVPPDDLPSCILDGFIVENGALVVLVSYDEDDEDSEDEEE